MSVGLAGRSRQLPACNEIPPRSTGKHVRVLVVQPSREALEAVMALCVEGKLAPAIDRLYPLSETAAALRYLGEGRAKGKVVVAVDGDPSVATEAASG